MRQFLVALCLTIAILALHLHLQRPFCTWTKSLVHWKFASSHFAPYAMTSLLHSQQLHVRLLIIPHWAGFPPHPTHICHGSSNTVSGPRTGEEPPERVPSILLRGPGT